VQSFAAHLRPSYISMREGLRVQAAMTSVIECGDGKPQRMHAMWCISFEACQHLSRRSNVTLDRTLQHANECSREPYLARGTTNIVLPVRSQKLWAKVVRDEVENVVPRKVRGQTSGGGGCSIMPMLHLCVAKFQSPLTTFKVYEYTTTHHHHQHV
jgi:hypothetical protein